MPIWNQLGMMAAGAGMGQLLAPINDRRQLRQQEKLQNLQIAGQQQITDYNLQKQMQLWEQTNYKAQVEQLKKAGLNPALLYGHGGPGGQTNVNTGNIGMGQAPQGGGEIMGIMAIGQQAAMTAAQIELTKAQTEKTKAETGNVPLTGENIKATTASITQGIENQKVQAELIEAQRYATNIMSDINARSSNSQVASAAKRLERETEDIKALMRENNINDQTIQDKINLIKAQAIGQAITNTLGEQKTAESQATIQKMAADIIQRTIQLDQEQQKIEIQKWVETVKANFPSIGNVLGRSLNDLIEGIIGASKTGTRTTHYQPPK